MFWPTCASREAQPRQDRVRGFSRRLDHSGQAVGALLIASVDGTLETFVPTASNTAKL
jgi:hypothetical protein